MGRKIYRKKVYVRSLLTFDDREFFKFLIQNKQVYKKKTSSNFMQKYTKAKWETHNFLYHGL